MGGVLEVMVPLIAGANEARAYHSEGYVVKPFNDSNRSPFSPEMISMPIVCDGAWL